MLTALVQWIIPMLFSVLIAAANYAIYMPTIDYMVAAYSPYAASATGRNALARDFLAGIAAMYSIPCKPITIYLPPTLSLPHRSPSRGERKQVYENVRTRYHLE